MDPEKPELDPSQQLGIDLGLNNFVSCVYTKGAAFIIEGKGLKSYNRWWNQQKARLQAVYAKQGVQCGKKLAILLKNRKNLMNNYMAQVVHWLIQECLRQKLGTLMIGKLKAIKQHLNLGR